MIENKEEKERVILVGVCVSDGDDTEVSSLPMFLLRLLKQMAPPV